MRFGVVLLAAGASSRMGQPKLLLPWGKKTILAHLLDQWTALSAEQILAVLERDSSLLPHLGKMDVAINAQPELGMFSSVQCAARWEGWRQDLTHFGITLGDQPHVSDSTLQKTIAFAKAHPAHICQPSRNGRPRHPVMLPKAIFLAVAHASESTLKQFLQAHESERLLCESEDAGLDLDIDTPEDYQRALSIHRASSAVPSS